MRGKRVGQEVVMVQAPKCTGGLPSFHPFWRAEAVRPLIFVQSHSSTRIWATGRMLVSTQSVPNNGTEESMDAHSAPNTAACTPQQGQASNPAALVPVLLLPLATDICFRHSVTSETNGTR